MRIITAHDLKTQFNIALVVSRFNEAVTSRLVEGAVERLKELSFSDEQITLVWVPGAVEIPVVAQRLARTNTYEVIVGLGAVIRGETGHYDYVCQQVCDGCLRVALEYDIPVIFGVLTTDNEEQAMARSGGAHGHKGREAVDCAFEMASVMRQIST
jgi:6,7-dimethyl-8-ribityllumazine synthase